MQHTNSRLALAWGLRLTRAAGATLYALRRRAGAEVAVEEVPAIERRRLGESLVTTMGEEDERQPRVGPNSKSC